TIRQQSAYRTQRWPTGKTWHGPTPPTAAAAASEGYNGGMLHVLTTLLCMAARVPRVEVFLVCLKETAEAATERPAALERKVREKAKENSLAVWRGMSL